MVKKQLRYPLARQGHSFAAGTISWATATSGVKGDGVAQRREASRLTVDAADRFELVINVKTANALGLTVPLSPASWRNLYGYLRLGA